MGVLRRRVDKSDESKSETLVAVRWRRVARFYLSVIRPAPTINAGSLRRSRMQVALGVLRSGRISVRSGCRSQSAIQSSREVAACLGSLLSIASLAMANFDRFTATELNESQRRCLYLVAPLLPATPVVPRKQLEPGAWTTLFDDIPHFVRLLRMPPLACTN